jgi:tetratricopeptide (TPR) repeat protein
MKFLKIAVLAGMAFALSFPLTACDRKNKRIEAEKSYIAAVDAYAEGQYADSLELARRAILQDRNFYQAAFLEGRNLFFSDKMEDAKKIFAKLVSKYPEYTEARIWHIRCLILQGDLEAAKIILDKELSFNQTDWRIYNLYSLLAQKTDNYEERLAMNRRAESILTGSARIYLDMAITWRSLGLNDRAQAYLEKAQQVTGANVSLRELERAVDQLLRE